MNYYRKTSTSAPLKLGKTINHSNKNQNVAQWVYYSDAQGTVKNMSFFDVYTKVTEYDEKQKDNYYMYNAITGIYTYCGTDVTSLQKKYSYFIKEKYPLIKAGDSDFYEYKGYEAATSIIPEVQYYTRKTAIDNNGNAKYTYTQAFKLTSNTYYFNNNGTEVIATAFSKGNTYYNKDSDGNHVNIITIAKLNFFTDEGYQKIDFTNPLANNDRAYFLDDNNRPKFLPEGYLIAGKINFYYRNVNSVLAKDENFEEEELYIQIGAESFLKQVVLKKFNRDKEYFTDEGIYSAVKITDFDEEKNYYAKTVITGQKSYYYPWNEIFDFNKPSIPLYVQYVKDGCIKYAEINRNSSLGYDPDTTYYSFAPDKNAFYPVPYTMTAEEYKTSPWIVYEKDPNAIITPVKHMQYYGYMFTEPFYSSNQYDHSTAWNVDVERPEDLIFWFDFLDTEGELSQYSNPMIGNRPKVENDSNVKAIYYRETPEVIFVDSDITEEEMALQKAEKPGYTFIRLNSAIENLFTISSQAKSAHDELNNLLYTNTYCTESVTITCLPVYHLQPNTRIFIRDNKSGINGEYIITKISMPLAYNGTMSISATKAVERIY